MAGFSKLESKVEVANSQVLAADLKLAVGAESTTVDVTATGTILQAENANIATNITRVQMEEVPNSGNNIAYAVKLAPGSNTGFGVVGSTQYLVDGLNFNDPYNNATNSGASNLTLGLNNVQESTITATDTPASSAVLSARRPASSARAVATVSTAMRAGTGRVALWWRTAGPISRTALHLLLAPSRTPTSGQLPSVVRLPFLSSSTATTDSSSSLTPKVCAPSSRPAP